MRKKAKEKRPSPDTRTGFRLVGILTLSLAFIMDQLSKWYVLEHYFESAAPRSFFDWLISTQTMRAFEIEHITSFLNIVIVWNHGISFGLFADEASSRSLFLIAVACVISMFFVYWLWKSTSHWQALASGLVIGGAFGNIWDRVRFDAVADFIDLYYGTWHYPAFNLADACITVGIILFIIIQSKNDSAFGG